MLPIQERSTAAPVDWSIPRQVVPVAEEVSDLKEKKTALPPRSLKRATLDRLGLLVVTLVYGMAAWLSWRKWPDLLVDFGAQLYLPWRLSQGSVLYRDVMYLTGGPVSQYYHAALFKLFGVSFLTLIISNLALGFGLLVLIYKQFLRCSDVLTATTACLGVTLVLAFAQYSDIGNYNFVAPYCHEVWHGVVLSIAAVSLLSSWIMRPRAIFAMGAGFCAGLVFMTKPEVFFALMLAFAAAFTLAGIQRGLRMVAQLLFGSLTFAVVPLLGFFIYFHNFENWQASLRSVLFAWVPLMTTSVSQESFYKWCMGLDSPAFHLRYMLLHFAIVGAIVVICSAWFRREINSSTKRLITIALVAVLIGLASDVDWVDSGRSLPLLASALCILLGLKYKSELTLQFRLAEARSELTQFEFPGAPQKESAIIFPLLWAVFGLGLLAKLGFFPRIWHYGFILAMPAFVAAIYLFLWALPGFLERFGVRRNLFRGTIWLLLMTAFLRLFTQSQHLLNQKTFAVGNGTDRVMTFNEKVQPAGPAVRSALIWLEKNASPGATLAVLPEGVMVNYLSRRVNPTKYLVWNPAELVGLGQSTMISTFQQNPPDYVMMIHRDASEYGVKFFGQQERFGLKLMQWINANYQPVCLIGNEPLRNSLFGIKILKRISSDKTE